MIVSAFLYRYFRTGTCFLICTKVLFAVLILSSCQRDKPTVSTLPFNTKTYEQSEQRNFILLDRIHQCTLIDRNSNIIKQFPLGLVNLLPDGTVLGRKDSFLVKLDSNLNELWKAPVDFQAHHEITTDENGAIYFFDNHTHDFMGMKVRFDVVKIYSPDGKPLYSWCVYDHLVDVVQQISKSVWFSGLPLSPSQSSSIEQYILQDPEQFIFPSDAKCNCSFEFGHFNALQVLPQNEIGKNIPAFKKGNILLSFNPFACYGILDTAVSKITWMSYLPSATWLHAPYLTAQQTILVLENCTDSTSWTDSNDSLSLIFSRHIKANKKANKPSPRLWASIAEYNPLSSQKTWEYTATPKENLCVKRRGNATRLRNGNILFCATTESTGGRVFEITPGRKIIWEYAYPEKDTTTNLPREFYRATPVDYYIGIRFVNSQNNQ